MKNVLFRMLLFLYVLFSLLVNFGTTEDFILHLKATTLSYKLCITNRVLRLSKLTNRTNRTTSIRFRLKVERATDTWKSLLAVISIAILRFSCVFFFFSLISFVTNEILSNYFLFSVCLKLRR